MSAWVHDYDTEEWVDAATAWYVQSDTLETPMGGGVVAFAQRDEGDRFAADNDGTVLSWTALVQDVRRGGTAGTTTTER